MAIIQLLILVAIGQLNAPKFQAREKASEILRNSPVEVVTPFLETATASPYPETRNRARRILSDLYPGVSKIEVAKNVKKFLRGIVFFESPTDKMRELSECFSGWRERRQQLNAEFNKSHWDNPREYLDENTQCEFYRKLSSCPNVHGIKRINGPKLTLDIWSFTFLEESFRIVLDEMPTPLIEWTAKKDTVSMADLLPRYFSDSTGTRHTLKGRTFELETVGMWRLGESTNQYRTRIRAHGLVREFHYAMTNQQHAWSLVTTLLGILEPDLQIRL